MANRFGVLRMTKDHWSVYSYVDDNGKEWYRACFVHSSLPLKPRTVEGMPKWFNDQRPQTLKESVQCVPPEFRHIKAKETITHDSDSTRSYSILFETIELALRMEAAFCLEHLFAIESKHWYEQSYTELMTQILARAPSPWEMMNSPNKSATIAIEG